MMHLVGRTPVEMAYLCGVMIPAAKINGHPCSPPLTLPFERWFGRSLTARQKAVVTLLEHQRVRQRRAAYLLVNDPDCHEDVKEVIVGYLRWYTTVIAPQFRPVLLTRRPSHRRYLVPAADRHFICRTSYSFTGLRGQTHHAVAVLDADRWLERHSTDGCSEVMQMLAPMMTRSNPYDILIIHGNIRPRRNSVRHANTFALMWRRNCTEANYLTLDIPTLTCNLDVDAATPLRWLAPAVTRQETAPRPRQPLPCPASTPRRQAPAYVAVGLAPPPWRSGTMSGLHPPRALPDCAAA